MSGNAALTYDCGTMNGPARKSVDAAGRAEGAMRAAFAVKSIASFTLPARITHFTATWFWSRLFTSPYARVLNGATRVWWALSIGITSDPAGISSRFAGGPGKSW